MSQVETQQPTGGVAGDKAEASGTTGATGTQGEKMFTQAEANAFAAEAKRKSDGELAKVQARLEEMSAKLMTADEKKIAEAVRAKEAELSESFAKERIGLLARAALAGKVHEKALDIAASLIPADTPGDQIAAKVTALLAEHPYLKADAFVPGVPAGGAPPSGDGNHYTAERIRALRESGEWPKHEARVMAALKAGSVVS